MKTNIKTNLDNKSAAIDKVIAKEDLFNVIKHGHTWHADRIKEELERMVLNDSSIFNHNFYYDFEDKYHFIYDGECYLFIFDQKIELRSDKNNVFNSGKTLIYKIMGKQDISTAYKNFKSLLTEDEK